MALLDALARERFMAKVELVPFSDCHYWTGQLNDAGYGIYGRDRAHRLSYEMENGPIPEIRGKPAEILHSCDNPMCVNPAHLRPGTQVENMRDAAERRRMPLGDRHHNTKISDADMPAVLAAIQRGEPTGEIAERFGVGAPRISDIRHGRVGINHPARQLARPTGRADRKMADAVALALYRRAVDGESPSALANEFGVKISFVQDVKRGNTYRRVTNHGS